MQLLLVRTVEDRCEAFMPYGTAFNKLSYRQLRLADRDTFVILNPIGPAQGVVFP